MSESLAVKIEMFNLGLKYTLGAVGLCSRCWLKLGCSRRVLLIRAASNRAPIRRWFMTSSEPAVLTAWVQTGSRWGLQAPCTRSTHGAHSAGAARCSPLRSLTVHSPTFLFLQHGAAAERGGADRDYRALQAQSYLYSAYRFTLTHHGAGRSIKSAAAYHWKKRNLLILFVRCIKQTKTQINHLHMTVETLVFAYWLHTFLLIGTVPRKMPIRCQRGLIFLQYISVITIRNKREISIFHQSHIRAIWSFDWVCISCCLFAALFSSEMKPNCGGTFHHIRITTVIPDATSHSIENSQLPVFKGLLIPAMTAERWNSWL